MGRWTNTTTYPNLASPDDADIIPIADVSEAAGGQQRTITWAQVQSNLATELDDLSDVDTYGVSDGQVLAYDSGTGEWLPNTPAGGGDVVGPASAVDDRIATFDTTTGKLIQDGGKTIAEVMKQSLIIACSDETTALTTGAAKVTFRMPYAFTLSAVRASVTTAPTGAAITVGINEAGVSILSTDITIDATTTTSVGAATAAVISDTALADNAVITIDIDTVGSSVAGAGLKVYLIGVPA